MKTLEEIAASNGLRLPVAYIEFMRNYPSALERTKLDLGWCQEPIADRFLRKAPESIAELNADVRTPGVPWTDDEGPWPNHFFVISDDQCGNYYAIDTRADDAGVFFNAHLPGISFKKPATSMIANMKGLNGVRVHGIRTQRG